MKIPFLRALRAPVDGLVQMAAVQCCLRKIPNLSVPRSGQLDQRIALVADWLGKLDAREVFNGSVLVAKEGNILLERHYGFADAEGRVPLTGSASFSLASVSKPFTGLGIVMLAHRGKLALDDPLARHVPELAAYRGITIRHLLHHTSGLPDHMLLADTYWDPEVTLTTADMIALFVQHRPRLRFAPGDRFEYSNTGYVLLGEIIARASGRSFIDFMEHEIFAPLGMKDSAAYNLTCPVCTLQCRATGMRRRFGCFGRRVSSDMNYLDGVFGDGGIHASVEDLLRWDAALRAGTLVPHELYEQAYTSGRLNDGEATGYGFGWEVRPRHVVEHLGEWEGFTTCLRRDLRKHTLLVVLSNLGPAACVDEISAQLGRVVDTI
jgi:CubicO group peptidase (beta-lactamase class C family)